MLCLAFAGMACQRASTVFFYCGNWLRLDRQVKKVIGGRGPDRLRRTTLHQSDRWHWVLGPTRFTANLLEAGLRIPPSAGSGNTGGPKRQSVTTACTSHSRNRFRMIAATQQAVAVPSSEAWWEAAWSGHRRNERSLMRPTLGGELPRHSLPEVRARSFSCNPS